MPHFFMVIQFIQGVTNSTPISRTSGKPIPLQSQMVAYSQTLNSGSHPPIARALNDSPSQQADALSIVQSAAEVLWQFDLSTEIN
jgi:hypothetical protein